MSRAFSSRVIFVLSGLASDIFYVNIMQSHAMCCVQELGDFLYLMSSLSFRSRGKNLLCSEFFRVECLNNSYTHHFCIYIVVVVRIYFTTAHVFFGVPNWKQVLKKLCYDLSPALLCTYTVPVNHLFRNWSCNLL
jgi:hypothetical protein